MFRQPRLDLPGVAQHIIQRGNDRQPCFFEDADRRRYLDDLREAALKLGCAVHACVLMTNHVHLLVTPSGVGQISSLMQSLGRRNVRYVTLRHHRTGTLWEGRFKACLVDSESYLLRCHRYIEMNPVRAGMVESPAEYPWSSHPSNALGFADPLLRPHPCYLQLAAGDHERRSRYRELFEQRPSDEELDSIRLHLQRQHALGPERFRAAIEAQLKRRAGPARIGRSRKRAPEIAL
ncbi:transposase [Pseudomarimonas salicorniae]|uniref:Transposase n=1 Tax=Pseudomarimonas salicorniae TaxID=2933270 RepID=A0ABT0GL89_9GAMM|nr:transposase [Lysobacter sp. CAU 1642]MCK7595316.1 transposase [Lysobacter sp. CAU 1642]